MQSAESALDSIHRSRSIQDLARQISRDFRDLDGTLQDLKAWFKALDPKGYKKRAPWTGGIERAYDRYKRLGEEHGRAHTAFQSYLSATRRNTTPEQHAERAKMALEWAAAALKYGLPWRASVFLVWEDTG